MASKFLLLVILHDFVILYDNLFTLYTFVTVYDNSVVLHNLANFYKKLNFHSLIENN